MSSVIRATILIAALGILSRILGAVRDAVFAHQFGAGPEMDIYVASFRLPDLLFNLLILGTLSAAFIPVFVGYLHRDEREAKEIASTIFNLTFLVMAAVAVLGFLVSPLVVRLLVPGFSAQARAQTLVLTRIMMLSPLFFSLSSVLSSTLHSYKRFFLVAAAPLLYNLSIIAGVVFLYPSFGLAGIAWAVVAGAFLHFAVQFPAGLALGLRPFAVLNIAHAGVRKIGKLFLPRIFGVELGQISLLGSSVLGSFLASGSIAVFYFAYGLNTVPLGVVAISFAIASFPTLAEFASRKNMAGFGEFLAKTMVQVLFFIIPLSVLMLLLRAQIVRLILGAGQGTNFSFADTRLVAQALGIFALSLFAQGLVPLLARAFYSLHNTVIPVLSGLAAGAINIILAIVLVKPLGTAGLALAFSLAIILHMLAMLLLLRRRVGGVIGEFLLVRLFKISIASVVMGVFAYLTLYAVAPLVNMQTYLGIAIQTASALLVAGLIYLILGIAIDLPETMELLRRLLFSRN